MLNVWYGTNECKELSNLAYRPFIDSRGRKYVSVEHAYQTWKSGKFDSVTYRKHWKEGSKFVGRRVNRDISLNLMYSIMKRSFKQNPSAKKALMDTLNEEITHNQDRSIWNKAFPNLLMQIREEFAD